MIKKKVIVKEDSKEYEFDSLKEAGRFLGMKRQAVSHVLNRKNGIGEFFTIKES